MSRFNGLLALAALALSLLPGRAEAIPVFARQYGMTCAACHSAVPRLNAYGQQFADAGMRLPHWESLIPAKLGDPDVSIPATFPVAVRMQAFVQAHEGETIDRATGEITARAPVDFQAPYQVKVLSSAPLTDQLSYYVYAIFAEKGENGTVLVEDAWFNWADLFGSGVSIMAGQFQVSDLMFPREVRLTFQDYLVYRLAGITYDRGLLLGRGFGPLDVSIGAVNGNGITESFPIDAPGLRRPDRLFDRDGQKSFFGRVGLGLDVVDVGVFGLIGERPAAAGELGADDDPDRDADIGIVGVDLRGLISGRVYWFGQALYNRWDGILEADEARDWWGGFVGVDWIPSDKWAVSLLYNHAHAGDLRGTGTIYEGIEARVATAGVAYYLLRNAKLQLEANVDLLEVEDRPPNVGHLGKEGSLLVGIDAAF